MWRFVIVVVIGVVAAACGDGSMGGSMMGSPTGQTTMMTGSIAGVSMVAISPAAGSGGVSPAAPIEIRFSGAMPSAMGFQVDLHVGDLSGPTVALACARSGDRTRLTCTPATPLQAGTRYVTHVGGGMTFGSSACGSLPSMMGGQWVGGGGLSTSTHGGMSWAGMAGWIDGCGGYGMAFPFTTA